MLARGRSEQGWKVLEGKEAKARPLALKRLEESSEPVLFRGAALYLADARVWGDEDHPTWRAKVETRLAKAQAGLERVAKALNEKGLAPAKQAALTKEQSALQDEEQLCLEGVGLLGEKPLWKDLIKTVGSAKEPHRIRGAIRGLGGPRGGLRDLLRLLNETEFARKTEPFQEIAAKELQALARSPQAGALISGLVDYPSSQGIQALQRLSEISDRIAAWRVVERAVRTQIPPVRLAATALVPRLRGTQSRAEFLALLLGDTEAPVRAAAARSLGLLPPSEVRPEYPLLVAALKDVDEVRLAAGKSLTQLTGVRLEALPEHWERWLSKQ